MCACLGALAGGCAADGSVASGGGLLNSVANYRAASSSAPKGPVRVPDVDDLPGKKPEYVMEYLGPPDIRREETGAEFWTYSTDDCSLYLILYGDESGGGTYTVFHMETELKTLSTDPLEAQMQTCIKSVATAYQHRPEISS